MLEIFFKFKFSKDFYMRDELSLVSLVISHDGKAEQIAFTKSRLSVVDSNLSIVGYVVEGLTLDPKDIDDITGINITFNMKHSNKKQKFKKTLQCVITQDRKYRYELSPKIVKVIL